MIKEIEPKTSERIGKTEKVPTAIQLQKTFFEILRSPETVAAMKRYEASKSSGLQQLIR